MSRESISQDQTDFSALVSTIPDDAEVVFLPWQLAANAQTFGEQMAEQGKTAVIFGSDGLFSADFTIDGSYVSSFAPDIKGIPEDAERRRSVHERVRRLRHLRPAHLRGGHRRHGGDYPRLRGWPDTG